MSRIWHSSLTCFLVTLLSCFSVGISCWLETNDRILSSLTAFSEHFSLFKIHLYSIKTNQNVYLTLGLWRYCIINRQNNTNVCSPSRIDFEIDNSEMTTVISNINGNTLLDQDSLLSSSAASHFRFVLLLLASLGTIISLIIILFLIPGKTRRNWQRRVLFRLVSLKSLIGATLTGVALGISLRNYKGNINFICSNLSINQSGYICQSYTSSTETILLGVSIGLFVLCAIHSAICSLTQFSSTAPSTFRANNSITSFFAENPTMNEKPSNPPNSQTINENIQDSYMEKLESHYSNSTSANNRASLRPPPQRQRSIKINNNHEASTAETGVQNPAHLGSERDRQSIDITSANILIPPAPPFANGDNRPSFSPDYRPPSYGSSHTFGALQGYYFGTDDSSQASSCVDRKCKADSIGANSSHLMGVSSSAAMQSNHTLGGDLFLNSPNMKRNSSPFRYHNNSSFSGDEDIIDLYHSTDNNNSIRSSIPSSQLISNFPQDNDGLYKRIDDYRQYKDKGQSKM